MSVSHKWRRFRSLSRPERGLLVQAFLLVSLTALALRVLGFPRCRSALAHLAGRRAAGGNPGHPSIHQAEGTARMVRAAACSVPWPASCLTRSLALWWLLRRQGIPGDLRIGVRKEAGRLKAHAWVECRGVVLNDGETVRGHFAPFAGAVMPGGG